MPADAKSKAQQRFLFAAEARGELPRGHARKAAVSGKAYDRLPERKKTAKLNGGHVDFQGLPVSVEFRAGDTRRDHVMKFDYGYIRKTRGVDGDHVDVFLGPDPEAPQAFVINQMKKGDWESFDEQKVMLGFKSAEAAKAAYLKQYDDPRFFGSMKAMDMDDFKAKVLDRSNHGKKVAGLACKTAGMPQDWDDPRFLKYLDAIEAAGDRGEQEAEAELRERWAASSRHEKIKMLPAKEKDRFILPGAATGAVLGGLYSGIRHGPEKALGGAVIGGLLGGAGGGMLPSLGPAPKDVPASVLRSAKFKGRHEGIDKYAPDEVPEWGENEGDPLVWRKIKKSSERTDHIAERIDDVGIGILAAPYAADAVGKLKNRKGVVGATGRAAERAGKWMHKHETPMELTGLAMVAPGVTNAMAKGVEKIMPKHEAQKRAFWEAVVSAIPVDAFVALVERPAPKAAELLDNPNDPLHVPPTLRKKLEKVAMAFFPDFEYLTEPEKLAGIQTLWRMGSRAARPAARRAGRDVMRAEGMLMNRGATGVDAALRRGANAPVRTQGAQMLKNAPISEVQSVPKPKGKGLITPSRVAKGAIGLGIVGTGVAGKKMIDKSREAMDPRHQHEQWSVPGVQGTGRVF